MSKERGWLKIYVFKFVFVELNYQMQEDKFSKLEVLYYYFFYSLDIQYFKNENEFVENKILKFVFEMLKGKKFVKVSRSILSGFY